MFNMQLGTTWISNMKCTFSKKKSTVLGLFSADRIFQYFTIAIFIICRCNVLPLIHTDQLNLWQNTTVVSDWLEINSTTDLGGTRISHAFILRSLTVRGITSIQLLFLIMVMFLGRRVWRYQREVIRIPKSKKDKQHNGQRKKDKQRSTQYYTEIKNQTTKTAGELGFSGWGICSCFTMAPVVLL